MYQEHLAVHDIELEVAHIPGVKNEVADLLSMLHVDNNINHEVAIGIYMGLCSSSIF